MAEITLNKEEREWNKQLTQHLQKYSYLRDWSELAAWLNKLKNYLCDRKGPVCEKEALLKRLSSSLNGALPVALHESTLEIYEMLFSQSIITNDELIITCIGLFSFFPQANLKNKSKIIEIFNKYLHIFGKNLQLLATGLSITILPALNEMHEPIIRDVVSLFDLLAKPQLIGQEFFSQAIWVAILRSANCRVAGLKFFSMKLGKGTEQAQQNDEEENFWNETTMLSKKNLQEVEQLVKEQQEIASNTKIKENEAKDLLKEYCPNIETLVINSISLCIQDSNLLAIKAGLDFLYKYLPLKTESLSDRAKLTLTKSVVWLMGKRDTSVTRKINLWLFGKPDIENRYSVNQKQLCFITEALTQFLNEGGSLEPLKITINILSEHEELPNIILRGLVRNMVSFCQRYEVNVQMFKEVSKLMHRFLQRMKSYVLIFCQALSESVIESIKQKKFNDAQENLNLSIFFLNKIIKQEDINMVLQSFLSMLLQALLLTHWSDRIFMRSSLVQFLQLMDKYKDKLKDIQIANQHTDMLTSFNQLFQHLITLVTANENDDSFEQEIHLMNKSMVRINQIFGIYSEAWVSNVITNIALNNPGHFLSPIEVIGEMMEKQCVFKKQILLRAEDASKNNCMKICLAKIWGILSLGHLQIRVIPLLLKIIKYFHGFFEKLLQHEFEVSGQIAIIKFRLFWEVAPKYPHIMGSEQVEEVSKFGLFKMLQFLDSGNPLVKYHSHIWISETFPSYHRVLNPILEIMLKPKECWYQTPQGQYVYSVPPQTAKILLALRYLRSFIRLVPQKFNKYIFKPLTPKILPYYQLFRGQDPSVEQHQIPYITPLIELVVRFTETKFVGGDNKGIDLAACELLQVLVRIISTSELSNYFLSRHFKDILRSLHFATINEEHLLQIQLLNLLKLIFNQSLIKKLADSKILKDSIVNSNLIAIILEGVSCNFPYIKQQFVSFLSQCIPLLLEHDQSCGQAISRVLNTYTNKIAYVNSKKVEASSLKDLQISQKNAEILILFQGIKELLSLFLNLHLRPFQKEKNQHDTDYGLFSFYSWKSYIFLKIEKRPDFKFKRIQEQISKQIIYELPSLVAIMAACWTISELRPYYGIHRQGLNLFNYQSFLQYNKALSMAQNRLQTQQSVESFIISLLRVLLNTNPGETMRAILNCWAAAIKDVETKIKLLQLLVFSGLPIEIFYSILSESFNPEKMNRKRKGIVLQCDKNNQQDILQFCQAFSHYNFQNPSFFQTHNLISIWLSFCKFVKIFDGARNALTLYNLLQLIDLFLKKNNPKEILRDEKIKKEILTIHNAYNDIVHLISGKLKIESPNQTIKINNLLPFPSSIFELKIFSLTQDNRLNHSYTIWEECTQAKMPQYVRLMGLTVTKRLAYNFLLTLYNQTELVLVRKVRELIVCVLPLVQQKTNSSLLVEGASELVLSLLEQKRQLYVKEVKNQILQIFNKQDFFICSSKTLQSWAKIIDLLIDNSKEHDLFVQYLQKVSLASSLFSNYTFQTKKKIKSFERICFILYAGKKDKYNDKAQLLIDKIIEVIKHSDVPQPVLILIFFCIRILILRFTQEKITNLLSTLWQMIIFLLSNIFSETAQKDKLNLHWAALKLIEMISLMQISEFHPHQWIFFYDYVGVKFSKLAQGSRVINTLLQPKIHKYLPEGLILSKEQIGQVQQKRHLIIKQDKIDDIELLRTKALLLSSYLISSNGCRMLFDIREVEELIDNDFLNLDEFIFKVK